MGDEQKVVDVEFTESRTRLDEEMGSRAANVASIFAAEPAPLADVIEQANKRFNYGENMTRQCLAWLSDHGMAKSKVRGGVVHWGRPVDVRKLVDAAAGLAEVVSVPVEAMGGEKAARVMREAASAARAVPVAVEGIKREAKPAVDALKRLGDAAKEAGIFRLRPPLDIQPPPPKQK